MSTAPRPRAPSSARPSPATVRGAPHCKASFHGRVPQNPRGPLPGLSKELILLAHGRHQASAGFDRNNWQFGSRAEPPPRGIRFLPTGGPRSLLARKRKRWMAGEEYPPLRPPTNIDPSRLAPKAAAETELKRRTGPFPSWLNDGSGRGARPSKAAPPETAPGVERGRQD